MFQVESQVRTRLTAIRGIWIFQFRLIAKRVWPATALSTTWPSNLIVLWTICEVVELLGKLMMKLILCIISRIIIWWPSTPSSPRCSLSEAWRKTWDFLLDIGPLEICLLLTAVHSIAVSLKIISSASQTTITLRVVMSPAIYRLTTTVVGAVTSHMMHVTIAITRSIWRRIIISPLRRLRSSARLTHFRPIVGQRLTDAQSSTNSNNWQQIRKTRGGERTSGRTTT